MWQRPQHEKMCEHSGTTSVAFHHLDFGTEYLKPKTADDRSLNFFGALFLAIAYF